MLRRQSIGQEGASAEFCDLSGRGLNTSQVERTLRVFDTAVAIDMSNNELEQIPATIPKDIIGLDVSFNMIADGHGIERLQFLQELHLGYNRLVDVSILEFCPLLQRVNLSGNRLTNTRGLETLAHLEHLDLSDNLIEVADELRALSMNQHLTHLTMRGNPIAHKAAVDYRVLVLDMIPSVLILDDKKIRNSTKCKPSDGLATSSSPLSSSSAGAVATKSLSYSRIYDDKKQFVIRHQQTRRTPATRPTPILLGDPNLHSKYEGNTIFIQSPKATTITQNLSAPYPQSPQRRLSQTALSPSTPPPPPAPTGVPMQMGSTVRLASPTSAAAGAAYMSLYDRLAAANGVVVSKVPVDERSNQTTSKDKPLPQPNSTMRPMSSHSKRDQKTSSATNSSQSATQPRRSVDTPATTRPPSRSGPASRPHTPAIPLAAAAPVDAPPSSSSRQAFPYTNTSRPTPQTTSPPPTLASPHTGYNPAQSFRTAPLVASQTDPLTVAASTSPQAAPPHHLDSKQQNVLSVIQNLIHHKKQTLATLARQSSSTNATTVFSS